MKQDAAQLAIQQGFAEVLISRDGSGINPPHTETKSLIQCTTGEGYHGLHTLLGSIPGNSRLAIL